MPYKNPNTVYRLITLKIRRDDPIHDAAVYAANNESKTFGEYIRQAIAEKLVRDGYMPESDNIHTD